MRNFHPRDAVVIGAGLMGRQIAAYLASRGIRVTLADLVIDSSDPTKLVKLALKALAKSKPQALASPHDVKLITPASFDSVDGICSPDTTLRQALIGADLVFEAVKEDLPIKRDVFAMIGDHVSDHAVLATNSSGLNLDDIASALPGKCRPRFMGMHFFNPVFWMRLLEMIQAADTDTELFAAMCKWGEDELGKGVVVAMNSPNFTANVLGVRFMQWVIWKFFGFGLTVNQADAVCAALGMRRPFDTLDIVGIGLEEDVALTTYNGIPDAPDRDIHLLPDWMKSMITNGMLGRATPDKGGFYLMVKGPTGKELHVIDVDTLQHGPQDPGDFPSLKAAQAAKKNTVTAIQALLAGDDPAAQFAKALVAGQIVYAAYMLGRSCGTVYGMDDAMRYGFNHAMGPFAMADAIGLRQVVELADTAGITHVPEWFRVMASEGLTFYGQTDDGRQTHYMPLAETPHYADTPVRERVLTLPAYRVGDSVVLHNDEATVMEVDGVVVVSLHNGKMNPVGPGIIAAIHAAVDYAEPKGLPIVITTNGENFSAGADLKLLLRQSTDGDEAGARQMSADFQAATWRLRFCRVPVVVGAWGFALGGGCEIVLAADRIVAATHLRIGLVEAGVGIIPGAGGTWMFLDRCFQGLPDSPARGAEVSYQGALGCVRHAFWTIGTGTMRMTAQEARDTGFLGSSDIILPDLDPKRVRWTAMEVARTMVHGYVPPRERSYPLPGPDGAAFLRTAVAGMVAGGFAHPHSNPIGKHLAAVLTGGDCGKLEMVPASRLLQLEQDNFVTLAMMDHARKCMEHMLKTGKSLLAGK